MSLQVAPGARPQRAATIELRYDWKWAEVAEIYRTPLPDLIFRAQSLHRQWHAPDRVQACQLLSKQLSPEAVTLCFLAGANSIFVGEKLLTTPNPGVDEDGQLLESLGMKPLESHAG